jgi:hypothetical protein
MPQNVRAGSGCVVRICGSGYERNVFRFRNTGIRRPYKMTNVETLYSLLLSEDFSPNRFVNLDHIKSVLHVYGDLRKILNFVFE